MNPIPITTSSLTSLNSRLIASNIIPSDVAQHMLQDQAFREELERQDIERITGAQRRQPDWQEMLAKEGKRALTAAKAVHLNQQSLPPTRAREPTRDQLFAGFAFSRTQDLNPENLPILRQALLGVKPKFSSKIGRAHV